MQSIQIHRILCPVDFSDFSQRALEHAVAYARWYDSRVTVFHVAAPVPLSAGSIPSGIAAATAATTTDRKEVLTALKRFADKSVGVDVPLDFEVGEGPVAAKILEQADVMPADLLVMGTHGRSGFERLILGSATEKILRRAACPVLTVPRAVEAAPAPLVLLQRILCAIDFSDCSMQALRYAVSLAREANAALTLMHVVELPPDLPREVHETVAAGPRSLQEYVAAARDYYQARLAEALPDDLRAPGAPETVVAAGAPYREIVRVAEQRKADLLVIGVRGRGAIDRLLFGSTANHLVRQAPCPVLSIRSR